ncbi:nuclear transport factor 2 family protein [Mycobacterium simiae]|uniref:Nuclear transport factor 2 family protein n=1 Tax=Mycobacterium simiae TaxID=1784 RepID=A0A5B1BAA4_MYCSI|nr:nuclear transport factor 2 family protein [Mycobacterium simiae]KAA1244962.1 nuclear transport factor 2 family protein [Mycobacterium simiae]
MNVTEEFADRFADFWKAPSPDRLSDLLHLDVLLVQPLAPPRHGLAAAQREFTRILSWLPDLRGEVDRWSRVGDVVFIEFRLIARFGNEVVEWPVVDRFSLRGDKAVERVSYFDSFPLMLTILKHPSTWLSWLRSVTTRAQRA